jgi:hypothetical protein
VKLSTHLRLVPRSRMRGAIPPLPQYSFMAWCSVKIQGHLYFFFPLASTVLIGSWPSLMDFSIHRHLVGLLGWGIGPTQDLYRNTGQHNTETRRHTSMPRAGFEPAISMFISLFIYFDRFYFNFTASSVPKQNI